MVSLYKVTFQGGMAVWIWADNESAIKRHIDRHYPGQIAYTITGEHPHEENEQAIVDEARDILAGNTDKAPTKEHLRVLLKWLDGGA